MKRGSTRPRAVAWCRVHTIAPVKTAAVAATLAAPAVRAAVFALAPVRTMPLPMTPSGVRRLRAGRDRQQTHRDNSSHAASPTGLPAWNRKPVKTLLSA